MRRESQSLFNSVSVTIRVCVIDIIFVDKIQRWINQSFANIFNKLRWTKKKNRSIKTRNRKLNSYSKLKSDVRLNLLINIVATDIFSSVEIFFFATQEHTTSTRRRKRIKNLFVNKIYNAIIMKNWMPERIGAKCRNLSHWFCRKNNTINI